MFETVAPDYRLRTRRAAYKSLPVSIALHVVTAAICVIAPQWHADFPDQPPRLVRSYSIATAPAPPPPAAQPTAKPTTSTTAASAPPAAPSPPMDDVAPNVIPDTIPTVPLRVASLSLDAMTAAVAPAASGDGREDAGGGAGDGGAEAAEGKPDGLRGGVLVGERVHFDRDTNLPLFVEHRRFPEYPEEGRLLHREADVTLRYIIGKDGKVKEVVVLEHARWPKFETSAIAAIRAWRFRPFTVGGETREVVHELVVRFRLE